jgi:hypothetical protein
MAWIVPRITSFQVGAPPLFSLEWWGHFLVWGEWFPNHLLLGGTDHI